MNHNGRMKKIIIYIVFGLVVFSAKCQPQTNDLSADQFENIKVNGATIKSIWETNGNEAEVKKLFGLPLSVNKEGEFAEGVISRDFYYNGLEFGFYNNFSANGNLGGFEITNSSHSITIRGVTVRIGDKYSKLGLVKLNTNRNGTKGILFVPDNDETIYLSIEFDQTTKVITKISYYVLT